MAITREQVLEALRGRGRPMLSARAILSRLGGHRGQAKGLRVLLRKLVGEGRLERINRRYRATRDDGLVEAVVLRSSGPSGGRGERAIAVDDSGEEWSVPNDARLRPGDRVLLWRTTEGADEENDRGRRGGADRPQRRGEILQVVSGDRAHWVGIFGRDRNGTCVTPYRDDARWRIHIGSRDAGQARFGEVVVVAADSKGSEAARPRAKQRDARAGRGGKKSRVLRGAKRPDARELRGRIVERLGRPGDAEADFRAVAFRHRLSLDFPAEAIAEAEAQQPGITEGEIEARSDLRDRCFVTIDPASARDHDDAVCVEPAEGDAGAESLRLWVAIADVAHFVKPGSALDREALRRCNSFYFPDRAIPMLPERLSSDLCSLRPDTDRLALVVELIVDAEGACGQPKFHQAIVRSRARLSYDEAAEPMAGEALSAKGDAEVAEQLVRFAEVSGRLLRNRSRNSSLDFDLPAAEVLQDPNGRPTDIVRARRTIAHRAVEDAMLVANRAVASALSSRSLPAVFRVHEPPSEERLAQLRELFESFGLMDRAHESLGLGQIADALRRVSGRPEESLVNQATLRAMRQARYHGENLGHYALGFESYLHFTSPIRRYADLVVHRQVKRHLLRQSESGQQLHTRQVAETGGGGSAARETMRMVSARTSFRERIAVQVEREILDLKSCALMSSRVGETFTGTVTGVARHGLYLTLDRPFVVGLLHVSELGDFVDYDERGKRLVARRSGRRYVLAERIEVRLISVDPIKGWISFGLSSPPRDKRQRDRKRAKLARG